jgi:hypothetical protein
LWRSEEKTAKVENGTHEEEIEKDKKTHNKNAKI